MKGESILATHIFMATKQTIAKAWKTPLLSLEEVTWQVHGALVKREAHGDIRKHSGYISWHLATLVGPVSSNEFAYPLFKPVSFLSSLPVMALDNLGWGLPSLL